MRTKYKQHQSGQAIITAVIFFLVISVIVLVGMASPVAYQIRNSADFIQSKQGFISSDTLNEEAFYRLNKGRTLPATLVLGFSSGTSTAQITDVNGMKQIISTGAAGAFSRISKSIFSQGDGLSINYGLQVGNGGITMTGGASIIGNVYSNGNISGSGGVSITGSAVAAVAASTETTWQNSSSTSVTVNIGTANATQDFAQTFIAATSTTHIQAKFYIKKVGTPANVTVSLLNDATTAPGSTVYGSGVLSASQVTTNYGWVTVSFASAQPLTVGNRYWLVFDVASNSGSNYYQIAVTNNSTTFTDASAKFYNGRLGGTWSIPNNNYDAFFELFTGSISSISGMTVGGTGGDARAFSVTNSTISGNLYCQTGSGNNKGCDTSQAIPSPLAYPFSDANIDEWESNVVTTQTRNSSWSLSSNTSTTSAALRINGNLDISGDAQLTVTGPLYVTGNLTMSGDGRLIVGGPVYIGGNLSVSGSREGNIFSASSIGNVANTYVVNGTVTFTSTNPIVSNGQAGNYSIVVSKSLCGGLSTGCSQAINVSGSAGAIVLLAPDGKVTFSGSGKAKAVIAYKIELSGGTSVTYDSGLADIDFSSGPSGAWNVDSWREISQ